MKEGEIMKKLISMTLVAMMTFMISSVSPMPNYAEESLNLDKPLLMQFNQKLNKTTIYEDIKFLDEKGNTIPILINITNEKEAVVIPLYDMKDIKVSLKSNLKASKTSAYSGETFVGDEANLKRLSELNQNQNRGVMYDMMPAPGEESMNTMDMATGKGSGEADSFSATNVQVEGVDEADIVKTDGKYIYYLKDNKIEIIKADKDKMQRWLLLVI